MHYLILALDGMAYGLLLFTVAAGLTLAFGAGGVLNLAHGSIYAVGAYAAAMLTDGTWGSLAAAVAVGVLAGTGFGALLAVGIAQLASRGHLAQALVTFGVMLAAGALLVIAFGPDDLRPVVPVALDQPIHIVGRRYPGYRLAFIGVALVLVVAGVLILTRTRWGARVRAMKDDPGMLSAIGTSPRLMLASVMAAGGALAGFAGSLGAPIIGAGPRTAEWVLVLSITIIVIGGIGSLVGAFFAAIAVGQLQTLGVVLLPDLAPYLLFAGMVLALVLRRHATPTMERSGH